MWLLLLLFVTLMFTFVILVGAPYLPTLRQQSTAALDLLDLKPGQTMLELGCGDGRVLKAAAKRGITGVGYELNPILFLVAWLVNVPHRRLVTVKWGNYWTARWPEADGIYVFLLQKYMTKLDKKIAQEYSKKVKLVSLAFTIPGRKPKVTSGPLSLYIYGPR